MEYLGFGVLHDALPILGQGTLNICCWASVCLILQKALGLPFLLITTPNWSALSLVLILNDPLKSGQVDKLSQATVRLISLKPYFLTCVY